MAMPDPLPSDSGEKISEQELKFGYWYVTHKLQLKRWLIIVLLLVDAVLVGFSLWGILRFYVFEAPAERQLELSLSVPGISASSHEAVKPLPLSAGNVTVLTVKNKYDLAAQIQNLNPSMYATFSYRFVTSVGETPVAEGFILPNEQKFVMSLGVSLSSRPATSSLELTDVRFARIDRHVIADYQQFAADRLAGLKITDVLYDPAVAMDSNTVAKTSFRVTNNSGFGYYAPRFLIIQYRGTEIGGINMATVDNLRPGDTRQVEVTWFESLPAISRVLVVPDINIFDETEYLRS